MDGLLLCCQNEIDVQEIVDKLNKEVEVKQLEPIKYYLGIQIERTEDGSFLLSQKKKIIDFTESVGMKDSKPVSIPLKPEYLKRTDGELLPNNNDYKSAIGKLLYLSKICRPAVGLLRRKTNSPSVYDWRAVKKLARYLKGILDYKLVILACDEPRLIGFMDANLDRNGPDGKSTSGYLFFYGNSLIERTSLKQSVVALSTAEAECISATSASQELEWIIHLL
ncbi:uncharacterized protein LOC132575710 [Heteronotia binoei]|uniref:uncharacterized protein LOC132575710 n=1 Tax=Heteronotia binoei TaxID=13085 RepID=UPI0029311C0E|nr:uncharacterized protein LOC132575710 [Heteronotia binoei]